jgi:hypothetical protein
VMALDDVGTCKSLSLRCCRREFCTGYCGIFLFNVIEPQHLLNGIEIGSS